MDAQSTDTFGSTDLHQSGPHHDSPHHNLISKNHRPNWASKLTVLILIVAALMLLAAMLVCLIARPGGLVKDNQYQAVFLTNGQVYFGKLTQANDRYVSLTNVYYLQQAPQNQQGGNQAQTSNNLSLIKLGNELHGPENQMFIANNQVLFWENLQDSGKVVQAIKSQAGK